MGSRGSSSPKANGRSLNGGKLDSKISKINKQYSKLGIPSNAVDLDEYLGLYGLSDASSGWVVDKVRGNRQISTVKGRERFNKEFNNAQAEYTNKRESKIDEYNNYVSKGILRPKTRIEKTLVNAQGHGDNASVQASRRMLKKRGIDWKTGNKIA